MSETIARHIVLTGPTSGIGLAAARGLAGAGARLTLVGRDETRLAGLASELGGDTGWVGADLSSLAETRRAAAEIRERHERVDVLVNNAGGMFRRRVETAEGIESTLALNHLSPFVLTSELLPLLRAAASGGGFGARVVNVASSAHRSGVRWDDVQCERDYSLMRAYGHSKALMVMTTNELARRIEGSGVTANSLHPGVIRTGIVQKSGHGLIGTLIVLAGYVVLGTPKRGGSHLVHLALADEAAGVSGAYWNKRRIQEPSEEARDRGNQERAWALSEHLAGMTPTA